MFDVLSLSPFPTPRPPVYSPIPIMNGTISMAGTTTEPNLEALVDALSGCTEGRAIEFFLFGSRAQGTARANSDWDIGVLGQRPLSVRERSHMTEVIEEWPTLHTIELVDLTAAKPAFREHILKHAVRIGRLAA